MMVRVSNLTSQYGTLLHLANLSLLKVKKKDNLLKKAITDMHNVRCCMVLTFNVFFTVAIRYFRTRFGERLDLVQKAMVQKDTS